MWNASRFCVSSLRRGHANLLCIVPILVYVLPKQVHQVESKTCIESIATQVAETKRLLCQPAVLSPAWPCGLMDKAPDFGSGDCRFESCHGRVRTFWAKFCLGEKRSQSAFYEFLLELTKNMALWTSPKSIWSDCVGRAARHWPLTSAIPLLIDTRTFGCWVSPLARSALP